MIIHTLQSMGTTSTKCHHVKVVTTAGRDFTTNWIEIDQIDR